MATNCDWDVVPWVSVAGLLLGCKQSLPAHDVIMTLSLRYVSAGMMTSYPWWRHGIETLFALLAFSRPRGIPFTKGQLYGAVVFQSPFFSPWISYFKQIVGWDAMTPKWRQCNA